MRRLRVAVTRGSVFFLEPGLVPEMGRRGRLEEEQRTLESRERRAATHRREAGRRGHDGSRPAAGTGQKQDEAK